MDDAAHQKVPVAPNNVTRRAQIIESCHKIFEGIADKTTDSFTDFKSALENVAIIGDISTKRSLTPSLSNPFEFPQKPIEQITLLEREVELERDFLKRKQNGRNTAEDSADFPGYKGPSHLRILCGDDGLNNSSGVSNSWGLIYVFKFDSLLVWDRRELLPMA